MGTAWQFYRHESYQGFTEISIPSQPPAVTGATVPRLPKWTRADRSLDDLEMLIKERPLDAKMLQVTIEARKCEARLS